MAAAPMAISISPAQTSLLLSCSRFIDRLRGLPRSPSFRGADEVREPGIHNPTIGRIHAPVPLSNPAVMDSGTRSLRSLGRNDRERIASDENGLEQWAPCYSALMPPSFTTRSHLVISLPMKLPNSAELICTTCAPSLAKCFFTSSEFCTA